MAKIISIVNQKGGVAKTTSTQNIAIGLAMSGKKTLMIDLDSQASLTISCGIEPLEAVDNNIAAVLDIRKTEDIRNCIYQIDSDDDIENCFIVPSIIDLASVEMDMYMQISREHLLSETLKPILNDYDYIIIDCPPQLSILTLNALTCADGIIIPVKTDYYSYRGLKNLLDTVAVITKKTNPTLEVYGLLATLYDKRVSDDVEILNLLVKEYPVLELMHYRAILRKGVYNGLAVVQYASNTDIAKAYMNVVNMIINGNYKYKENIQ